MTVSVAQPEPQPEAKPASPVHEVTLAKAAAFAAFGSVISIVSAIVKSKITAVILGPEGIGMSAEINQIFALVQACIAFVSGPAFITVMAKARGTGDKARVQE